MKAPIVLSVVTAISASLCCITPLLALTAGTGSVVSNFSWIEPFRPYFISATICVLGFAWFRNLNTKKADDCGCEPKVSFMQSKKFLGIITILSLVLISFPSYAKFFYPKTEVAFSQDQQKSQIIELAVKGMTCGSCEVHIEGEVKKLPGISLVKASYEKGSAIVEFDDSKVDKEKIIAAINATGYSVVDNKLSTMLEGKENCTAATCQLPTGSLPTASSKELIVLNNVDQIKKMFNRPNGKTKFVAILSSTCKWCLQGAESVQQSIIDNAVKKNIDVIIVWTNMLKSDSQVTAYHAASLFDNKNVIQFFDVENKFGDVTAKTLNPKGAQAWDIYMFFDKNSQWTKSLPTPFDYAHQLGASSSWIDQSKYFCGSKLTEKLDQVVNAL